MEADMRRFYGLSLYGDFWSGRLDVREMISLVRELPFDSALARLIEPRLVWQASDYLLADLSDQISMLTYLFKVANFKGNHRPPEPHPRPAEAEPEPEFATIEQARAILAGLPKPGTEVAA